MCSERQSFLWTMRVETLPTPNTGFIADSFWFGRVGDYKGLLARLGMILALSVLQLLYQSTAEFYQSPCFRLKTLQSTGARSHSVLRPSRWKTQLLLASAGGSALVSKGWQYQHWAIRPYRIPLTNPIKGLFKGLWVKWPIQVSSFFSSAL